MVNRYIIKLDKSEDVLSVKNFFAQDELTNKIILKHFFYGDESDQSNGEHFLFYESSDFDLYDFLEGDNKVNINEENIIEVEELSEEIISGFDEKCPDVVYITNFPSKFTDNKLLQLLSNLPNNKEYSLKIERLPCVFKISYEKASECSDWIKSILRFCPHIKFDDENLILCAEINCLKIPVIHFIDLPPTITTIEYFIEVLKNDLGDYKLYEENDRKSNQPLSFNISYQSEDEAWDIIDQLNFHPFEGKEIRVNHFIDTKFLQEMATFNIKVTNYEGELNSYDIYENFSQFGSIYSIYNNNPLIDENGSSSQSSYQPNSYSNPQKDYFCIQYYLKKSATDAISKAKEVLNMDKLTITMKDAGLVVYNFEKEVTEAVVREIFKKAIKIVIKQSKDRNSRPYVFINFTFQDDCEEAKEICKNTYRKHLRLTCVPQTMTRDQAFLERKKEEERCQKRNTVFLQKIPDNIFAEDVIQECGKFGDMDSVVFIVINNNKMHKRLAKVSFHDEKSFNNALTNTIKLNNRPFKLTKYIPHSH